MDIGGGVSRAFCTHEKGKQSGHHLVSYEQFRVGNATVTVARCRMAASHLTPPLPTRLFAVPISLCRRSFPFACR